jgi:hypothetical protein
MALSGKISCGKCGKDSKQMNKLCGKPICPRCSYDFYKRIQPILVKNPKVKSAFKEWFFLEMEMEEY